jgi:hypothetical protein
VEVLPGHLRCVSRDGRRRRSRRKSLALMSVIELGRLAGNERLRLAALEEMRSV